MGGMCIKSASTIKERRFLHEGIELHACIRSWGVGLQSPAKASNISIAWDIGSWNPLREIDSFCTRVFLFVSLYLAIPNYQSSIRLYRLNCPVDGNFWSNPPYDNLVICFILLQ